jgi:2-polyprenyl-3-methyl-5-hydroxy-6-metoxy-1,4-benzoquinol methylase
MNRETQRRIRYWDRRSEGFDAIYSQKKSAAGRLLDRMFRWDMAARLAFALEEAEPIAGKSFLDVGCGSGWYSLAIAEKGAGKTVGLDFSAEMIRLARERAAARKLSEKLTFVQADVMAYQPETSYDVGLAIGLFDYVKDPRPLLVKMSGWVGDRIIATFPRKWTWRAAIRKIRLGLQGCPVYFYTAGCVASLMKEAGFRRVKIQKIGQLHGVVAWK